MLMCLCDLSPYATIKLWRSWVITLVMTLYSIQDLSITITFGLTLSIFATITFKQVSNAICLWFEPRSKLHTIYTKVGFPCPLVYVQLMHLMEAEIDFFKMWSWLPKSSFATIAHIFPTSIDLEVLK